MTNYAAKLRYNYAMEIIYIDLHFMINLLADYLLCLACARFNGLRLKRLRYLFAALLGAGYSVAVLLPGLEWLGMSPLKLLCALLMAFIAYGREQQPLRCALAFLGISAAFGGTVWALNMANGANSITLSTKTLFLSFALCYALLSLFFRSRARLPEKPRAKVKLGFLGRVAEFSVLLDTGNSLSDPVSGSAVMPVCPHALKPLFIGFEELMNRAPIEFLEQADKADALRGKFRLIPYSALSGSGILPAFRPDYLCIDEREQRDVLVAISPNAHGDGFEGIF